MTQLKRMFRVRPRGRHQTGFSAAIGRAQPVCRVVDNLETRVLPAAFLVSTLVDESDGDFTFGDFSLRETIEQANLTAGTDTIGFSGSMVGTISLQGTELLIGDDTIITGPGAAELAISGAGLSRVFSVAAGASVSITDLSITDGSANSGAGIHNAGDLSLQRLHIHNNVVSGNGGSGAGIMSAAVGGSLVVMNSTISANEALTIGSIAGGIAIVQGDTFIINSTISGNTADLRSGGIEVGAATIGTAIVFRNTTITGNVVTLASSVGPGNSGAGGIGIGTREPLLMNTIVAGNWAASGTTADDIHGLVGQVDASSANNLIGSSSSAGGLADGVNGNIVGNNGVGTRNTASVLQLDLTNNFGPTPTHALTEDSPAIDAGDNAQAVESDNATPLTNDQRGAPLSRTADGDGDATSTVDIGAYEVSAEFIVSLLADESDGDLSEADISLREAIEQANLTPGPDRIGFATGLTGTITLGGTDLDIIDGLLINGPGADVLTVSGNDASRVFDVSSARPVTIRGLGITSGSAVNGAAIVNSAPLNLEQLHIRDSTASNNAGGVLHTGSETLVIRDSTISGNNAVGGDGGGIVIADGTVFVINSTVSGSSALGQGGGIQVDNAAATVTVTNTTVTGNSVIGSTGGGINISTGTLRLNNTIVAGNFSVGGTSANDIGGVVDSQSTTNVIGDSATAGGLTHGTFGNSLGVSGNGILNTLELLDPVLNNHGGTTPTHALVDSGIAVDTGTNLLSVDESNNRLLFDQRGDPIPREFDGDGNETILVDIGAFESARIFLVDSLSNTIDGDYTLNKFSLPEALALANTIPGADIIRFRNNLPGTINLSGTALAITDHVLIDGSGAAVLTIDAGSLSEAFTIASDVVVTLQDLTMQNGSGTVGGAIVNAGTLTILRSEIRDSIAATSGGGISHTGPGTLTIRDSTIADNQTTVAGGGGIVATGGSVLVINSTVSGNLAVSHGGGIAINAPTTSATFVNTTITGNRVVSGTGGGIRATSGNLLLNNSIVADNLAGAAASDISGNANTASSHNLIGNAATAAGIVHGVDGNIVGNDGAGTINIATVLNTTLTYKVGPLRIHRILKNSPAVDAGQNSLAVDEFGQQLTSDERGSGFPRITDGNARGVATVDIGAYEIPGPVSFVVDNLVDESDGDFGAGDLSLREAIERANALEGPGEIRFQSGLNGAITLGGSQLSISNHTTITGPGADQLTISAANNSRVFHTANNSFVTIADVSIADGNASGGGGIRNQTNLTLHRVHLRNNVSTDTGGGILNLGNSQIVITDSTISGNQATGDGGAISNAGVATIINSTLSGNTGSRGGGAAQNSTSGFQITNSTITGNDSTLPGPFGGGLWITNGAGPLVMHNTIVAGNIAAPSASPNDIGRSVDATSSNNLIGDATSAGSLTNGTNGNITGNAGIGTRDINTILDTTLTDNDGPTLTHALANNSPAIDNGNNALAVDASGALLDWDQRGANFVRSFQSVDIGALETQPAVPAILSPGSTTTLQRPRFEWSSVSGAVGYELWIGNQSTGDNPFHRVTTTDPEHVPDLDFGIGRYNLWVRAQFAGNAFGPWSPQYNFTVNTRVSVDDPGRFLPTHTPTLAWDAVPGAVRYDLWIDDKAGGTSQFIRDQNVTGTSWSPSADMPLGLYHAWVRGVAADGTSAAWSVTTIFYVMPGPTVTTGMNPTFDRTPTFAWNGLTGAAKYEVFVRDRNTGLTALYQQNISTLDFTPSADLADGPYRVWIIGVSGDNIRGFWTDSMDIYIGGRTDVLTPTGTTTDTTPAFTWRTVDGAVRYDLWVDQIGGISQIIREQNLTTPGFTPATALPTGNYRVWVRAISTTGETSDWSITVNFIVAQTSDTSANEQTLTALSSEFSHLPRSGEDGQGQEATSTGEGAIEHAHSTAIPNGSHPELPNDIDATFAWWAERPVHTT
jgi:fibronectin-binding autotransporter adhesin